MTKKSLNKWIIILGGGSLLIIIIWAGLFFLIQQDKKVVLAANQGNQQATNNPSGVLHLSKEKTAKINSYFLSGQTIKLLEDLEQLGQRAGLKLTIGQAGDTETELKLNLSTEGTFSQTMKFLGGLENLPYATRVDRLELRKGEKLWQSVFILRILKNKKNV